MPNPSLRCFQAFGPLPAFLFLWISLLIVNPTSNAVIALTFAQYVLKPFFPFCSTPETPVRLIAACIIGWPNIKYRSIKLIYYDFFWWVSAFLTFVNCANVRWATRTQDWSTVAKVGALVVIVLAGLLHVIMGG
jgi:amino acid transporter